MKSGEDLFYDETTTDVILIIMPNPADVIKTILCNQNIHFKLI